ncbi:hypothetical protein SAMN05444352_101290 [Pseudomonas japonica]|uniref:Uncharacterized protein n=1 Tax=Pseudomonas japonica TaxID=256466 RepID=A0A239A968_9PSED|nr:hypothetical protein SAMN05444352_101290 [Pseudomonas japonica]
MFLAIPLYGYVATNRATSQLSTHRFCARA